MFPSDPTDLQVLFFPIFTSLRHSASISSSDFNSIPLLIQHWISSPGFVPLLIASFHLLKLFDHFYLMLNMGEKLGELQYLLDYQIANRLLQARTTWYCVKLSQPFPVCRAALPQDRKYEHSSVLTWSGMTIMKIFLSLSDRMCLMKAQPVPMRAIVMNRRAPFSLEEKQTLQWETILFYHTSSSAQVSPTANKATNPNKCLPIHNFGKHLSMPQEWSRCTCYNSVSQSNIRLHSQYMQSFPGGVIHPPLWAAAVSTYHSHQEQMRYLNISVNKEK